MLPWDAAHSISGLVVSPPRCTFALDSDTTTMVVLDFFATGTKCTVSLVRREGASISFPQDRSRMEKGESTMSSAMTRR